MSSSSNIKKSLNRINFDVMVDDMCDHAIVHDKFERMYSDAKKYLAHISHIYNAVVGKIQVNDFKDYVNYFKACLMEYRDSYEEVKSINIFAKRENIDNIFLRFCRSEIVDQMMYCFGKLCSKEGEWIIKSTIAVKPFKGCDIDVFSLYKGNKKEVSARMNQIKECTYGFYKTFIMPNFNMSIAIENICGMLDQLHSSNKVKCNLVSGYLRRVHNTGVIDMEKMNIAYLEANNKAMFIIELTNTLLNIDSSSIKANLATTRQIKGLLTFLSNHGGSKIQSTLGVGKDLVNGLLSKHN